MIKKTICLVVTNDVSHDPRVNKEATFLSKYYNVIVLGFYQKRKKISKPYKILLAKQVQHYFPFNLSILKKFMKKLKKNNKSIPIKSSNSKTIDFYSILMDISKYLYSKINQLLLFKKLSAINASIYHANDLDTLFIVVKVAKKKNAKIIYDSHELYIEQSKFKTNLVRKLLKYEEEKYIKKTDCIITVNESISEELKKRYKLKKSPFIISNCPFKTSIKSNIKHKNKIDIIYTGGFESGRGLKEIIESFIYLPSKYRLYFLGYGPLEKQLKLYRNSLNLEKKIIFLKPVEMTQIVNRIIGFDIGIIPYQPINLNNYYALPNKIFEYINAGLAIVGSDIPEIKKIINKYKLGFVFDPFDPKDIANSIKRINSKNIQIFKKNSQIASKKENWNNESRKLLKIYKSLEKKSI